MFSVETLSENVFKLTGFFPDVRSHSFLYTWIYMMALHILTKLNLIATVWVGIAVIFIL